MHPSLFMSLVGSSIMIVVCVYDLVIVASYCVDHYHIIELIPSALSSASVHMNKSAQIRQ